MTPEAAKYAGPKLRAVCEKLNIPPVLNFGPCLAIGRLEIVATEIAAELGVDLPQLPLVLSAAQWLEEQALADGCFGLALGLPLHLGLPPFVTGSKTAVKVLTEDMKELTGGQVIINGDAKESADILEQIILEKTPGLTYIGGAAMRRIMIDASKCDGCKNCTIACMQAHRETPGTVYDLDLTDIRNESRNHIEKLPDGTIALIFADTAISRNA